jgi:hypothetical protein
MIAERFATIEADFARYYQTDPLDLSWRKFTVLLRGLPYDSGFWSLSRHLEEEEAPFDVFAAIDAHQGRTSPVQVERFGVDSIDRIYTRRFQG